MTDYDVVVFGNAAPRPASTVKLIADAGH